MHAADLALGVSKDAEARRARGGASAAWTHRPRARVVLDRYQAPIDRPGLPSPSIFSGRPDGSGSGRPAPYHTLQIASGSAGAASSSTEVNGANVKPPL